MKKTEKGTKKFTKEEKLSIIEEAKSNGMKLTLSMYGIYPATYYYSQRKQEVYGDATLGI